MNLDKLEDLLTAAERIRSDTKNNIQIIAIEGLTAVAAHLLGRHDDALAASDRGYAVVDDEFLTMLATSEYVYPFVVTPRAIALASVGRSREARAYIRDALPDFDKIRLPLILNSIVIGAAVVCALEGDWPRAALLHEATRAAGALFRDPTGFALFRHYDARIRANLDADAYARWTAEGQRTTLPDALAIGLSEQSAAAPLDSIAT